MAPADEADWISRDTVAATMASRIKALRASNKLTLEDLSLRTGTTKSHIWAIENGRSRNPTIATAVLIANALGVSLDHLTGLDAAVSPLHPEALRIAVEIDALLRNT